MHPKGICSPGGSLARTLIFAMVLGMAGVAHADDSFETKAQGAQRIGSIEGLVWTFTASCDDGDDTEQRQCRKVRDARAAELAGATLLVEGDKKAFAKTVANARVQLLVKVPAKPKTQAGGKPAIALDVVGYRVIVPCDGSVVLASPASGPVDADKKQCAAPEPAPKKK
jgi:hypothetical protein